MQGETSKNMYATRVGKSENTREDDANLHFASVSPVA